MFSQNGRIVFDGPYLLTEEGMVKIMLQASVPVLCKSELHCAGAGN